LRDLHRLAARDSASISRGSETGSRGRSRSMEVLERALSIVAEVSGGRFFVFADCRLKECFILNGETKKLSRQCVGRTGIIL
jgi:hypothetical protein